MWHSLRASCESDLARRFPLAVVAKWLGNTQAIALRHYVDVTDADFDKAVAEGESEAHKAAQKAAQHAHASPRNASQSEWPAHKKPPALRGSATSCDTLRSGGMERKGVEPSTSALRTQRSPN